MIFSTFRNKIQNIPILKSKIAAGKVVLSKNESPSQYQQGDYKGFSPSTDWDTVDFSKSPSMQEMPVISAICSPQSKDKVFVNKNGCVTVKGNLASAYFLLLLKLSLIHEYV